MRPIPKNLALLETSGLLFEAQFDANCNKSSDAIITCFSRFPRLCLVLNHAGFPPASAGLTWQDNMRKLSKLSQVNVKVSGWEMTDRAFALKWIDTHLQTMLGIFSDFPINDGKQFSIMFVSTLLRRFLATL